MPDPEDLDTQPKLASLSEPLEGSPSATQREAIPAPPVEEPARLAPPTAPSPAMQEEMGNLAAETSASAERINSLPERLADLENRVRDNNRALKDRVEEAHKKLDALTTSLTQIEEKIAALPAQNTVSAALDQPAAPVAASAPAPAKKAPPPKEQPAPPPAKPATASASRASSTVEIRPESAAQWELRAAQPGKAMVANKSNGDVLSVNVGDSLRGIGRITAIDQQNGKWVVQGTTGSISQ